MILILIDPDPKIFEAWKEAFAAHSGVKIVQGYFENLPEFDCMVSAANSFGLMDGGVDLAIIKFFGLDLMERVQERIIREYRGEQPIGTSMIVETLHERHPFIAHTPTMRIPVNIQNTENVYVAMFAMLLAVDQFNKNSPRKINSIACPGLGTATGKVSPRIAAAQMELAYRNFQNPPRLINWPFAITRNNGVINSLV
ncbi:MAG: macro domain-containing protein [Bacteroidia bacterium]|nr:macro domain-containing protein [Bacteroidia bacterium]